MDNDETDSAGAPIIKGLNAHLGAIERRVNWLRGGIQSGRGSRGSMEFDKAELAAHREAIRALRYHRQEVEKLDGLLLVLQAISDWHDDEDMARSREPLKPLLERVRRVLGEWE